MLLLLSILPNLLWVSPILGLQRFQMFKWGVSEGDHQLTRGDDLSSSTHISPTFPFFNKQYDHIWIHTNGAITFTGHNVSYNAIAFPLDEGIKMVAPFWTDFNNELSGTGDIYYRAVTRGPVLSSATSQIKLYYPGMGLFRAKWVFIATWDSVTWVEAPGKQYPSNTFQCVLVTDGKSSFAIFNYLEIAGQSERGANIGFDAGDGVHFYNQAGGLTDPDSIRQVAGGSNLHPLIPGKYIFRLDGIVNPVNGKTHNWAVYFYTRGTRVTLVNRVEVVLNNDCTITISSGSLMVNGVKENAPWFYPNEHYHTCTVLPYGTNGYLVTTEDMLRVTFDGSARMEIQIPEEKYGGQLQGVCGNADGNPANDGICPKAGFHINSCWNWTAEETWRAPNGTQEHDSVNTGKTKCKVAASRAAVKKDCDLIIYGKGPFRTCLATDPALAKQYYSSCMVDLCFEEANLCDTLEAFATTCMEYHPDNILRWRTPRFCPARCPRHMHYEDCSSSCPATCDPDVGPMDCPLPCKGSCACDKGFVQDNHHCIQQSKCGCEDELGNYHSGDEKWVAADCSKQCHCEKAKRICEAKSSCHHKASCVNIGQTNQKHCACNRGYQGNGYFCWFVGFLQQPQINGRNKTGQDYWDNVQEIVQS